MATGRLNRWLNALPWVRKNIYQRAIADFSRDLHSMAGQTELMNRLLQRISGSLKSEHASIFLLDESKQFYRLLLSTSGQEQRSDVAFALDSDLVQQLSERGEIIDLAHTQVALSPQTLDKLHRLHVRLCVPMIVKERLIGILVVSSRAHGWEFSPADLQFLREFSRQGAVAMENSILYRELYQQMLELESAYAQLSDYVSIVEKEKQALQQAYLDINKTLVTTLEARDSYTRGHSDRVTYYSRGLARQMGLTESEVRIIELGASFHDIGKIGVGDSILYKPGAHTAEEEWEMRRHPIIGEAILKSLTFLQDVIPLVRGHHERYDGTGYPDGLKGRDIPQGARVIAVGDAFDAMTTDRPYRKGMPEEQALVLLKEGAGAHFDPEAVDAFCAVFEHLMAPGDESTAIWRPSQAALGNP